MKDDEEYERKPLFWTDPLKEAIMEFVVMVLGDSLKNRLIRATIVGAVAAATTAPTVTPPVVLPVQIPVHEIKAAQGSTPSSTD